MRVQLFWFFPFFSLLNVCIMSIFSVLLHVFQRIQTSLQQIAADLKCSAAILKAVLVLSVS